MFDAYNENTEEEEKKMSQTQVLSKTSSKFTNTIYENFFGSKMSQIKVVKGQVRDKVISTKVEKLGPIYLDI